MQGFRQAAFVVEPHDRQLVRAGISAERRRIVPEGAVAGKGAFPGTDERHAVHPYFVDLAGIALRAKVVVGKHRVIVEMRLPELFGDIVQRGPARLEK